MNRAEPARLLSLDGKVRGCKNNRTRLWVTRAEIVNEILGGLGRGVEVENKQLRFLVKHQALRFA
jgi:hypothetical protein